LTATILLLDMPVSRRILPCCGWLPSRQLGFTSSPPHIAERFDDSTLSSSSRRLAVSRSVLEAIKQGEWNYEPASDSAGETTATAAMPGSVEKLDVLADRLRRGLPLWHPRDRISYDDADDNP
jgi:hypothetical protein